MITYRVTPLLACLGLNSSRPVQASVWQGVRSSCPSASRQLQQMLFRRQHSLLTSRAVMLSPPMSFGARANMYAATAHPACWKACCILRQLQTFSESSLLKSVRQPSCPLRSLIPLFLLKVSNQRQQKLPNTYQMAQQRCANIACTAS